MIYLGVVDQGGIGDVVVFGQLGRVFISNARNAIRFGRLYIAPKRMGLLRQTRNILLPVGRRCGAAGDKNKSQPYKKGRKSLKHPDVLAAHAYAGSENYS